ncbi:hypothetical protein HY631_02705 [Candidatus Uhrbacteria bacterium]|nr:hypothetical protein [Candidatus Uhrbacteria bacterium]
MSEQPRSFQEYHTKRFAAPELPLPERQPVREESDGMKVFQAHPPEAYIAHLERVQGEGAVEAFQQVLSVARSIQGAGGRALLVGGSVRDEVLGMPSKDFDIEVYGIEPSKLELLLARCGRVDSVGRAFGILKLVSTDGLDLDFSIPRRDSKVAEGHKGFDVNMDPDMSILEAARRRDLRGSSSPSHVRRALPRSRQTSHDEV